MRVINLIHALVEHSINGMQRRGINIFWDARAQIVPYLVQLGVCVNC